MKGWALYDMRLADGDIIYVGISKKPSERARQHRAMRRLPECYLSVVRWYATEVMVRDAEGRRIARYSPKFNIMKRRDADRPPTASRRIWDKSKAADMLRAGVPTADVAAAVGVDKVTITTNLGDLVRANLYR